MKTWVDPQPVTVSAELRDAVGGHPLVAETLLKRGIHTSQDARAYLDPQAYKPASPYELPGMKAAVARISRAIERIEKICVWGDFDVDGQTSTAILVSTLKALGARVDYHIPVRERESHGVNIPMLDEVIARGAQLVLTCDTGIAAHEAVLHAKTRGIDFVITDHHELPETLPEAYAVINPRLLPSDHALTTLPGAGTAYKLAEALLDIFQPETLEPEDLLDLTALGIVADVAELRGDARYLVQRGLDVLRHTDRLGLKALMESARVNPNWLTEEHIGFAIGPRLNALGRLSDANVIVEFFTTKDWGRARVLATTLEGLNAQRQLLTAQIFQAAQAQIERDPSLLDYAALVLAHPAWHAGVIGIVASRLVEHYNKPVVLLAAPEEELARGSARSIEGINITKAIATQRDLLAGFGGHPMAAGMGMPAENIAAFREGLSQAVEDQLADGQLEPTLRVDAALALSDLNLTLIEALKRFSPFGAGNPPLIFSITELTLKSHSTIGRGGEHLRLTVEDLDERTQTVLWWQGSGWPLPQGRFDLACTLRASDYRGQRDIQVEWVDYREIAPVEVTPPPNPLILEDYREHTQPIAILKELAGASVMVWAEAEGHEKLAEHGVKSLARHELAPSQDLIIWTTPSGPLELQAVMIAVQPEKVYLFASNPNTGDLKTFLQRLAGLVKFALYQRQGKISWRALVAATAQGELTVRAGLAWLEAGGYIQIIDEEGDEVLVKAGSGEAESTSALESQIGELLAETAAYRSYFRKTEVGNLLPEKRSKR